MEFVKTIALTTIFVLPGLACSTDLQAAKLASAGPMTTERAAHTATKLRDGRILIAGGFGDGRSGLRSTETFDPATGRFSPGPDLITARFSHTATLLPDGNVLVAGGMNNGYLDSAEIFDVASGRFRAGGRLNAARSDHVAIALTDGRILFAGGVGSGWTFLASAEVYDPGSGSFETVGPMSVERESHTATLLEDGRVLVAGGHRGRRSAMKVHDSAEIFDAAQRRFFPAGKLMVPRHKHDAVRIADGRVLIIAGSDGRDSGGKYRTTEYFDPRTNRFSPGPDLLLERFKLAGTSFAVGDRLVILGGARAAEIMDTKSGVSRVLPDEFGSDRYFAVGAVLRDNRILIAGGYDARIRTSSSAWLLSLEEKQ